MKHSSITVSKFLAKTAIKQKIADLLDWTEQKLMNILY